MPSKFTADLTPFDNFGGRSKVRYGVGEQVKLDATETPATKPPTALEWKVKSGGASVHNDPKVPGKGTLDVGTKVGSVVLELHDVKAKTVVATKRFEVVAPTGAKFGSRELQFDDGAGFQGAIFLEPFDVSFQWVEMREGAAPYEGKGCFAKAEVTTEQLGKRSAVIHPVMGSWVGIEGGKSKNRARGIDTVSTRVGSTDNPGEFVWSIPWFYRVKGKPGETRFTTAVHKATLTAAKMMTVSKLNIKVSKQLT